MKKLLIGATVLLAACGLSEDKFAEEFQVKACEAIELCGGECPEPVEDGEDTMADCDFDAVQARVCLDAYDALTEEDCDEASGFPNFPTTECEVYDCSTTEDGEE